MAPKPSTVLFDLDGTLLDTAPDLAWALNQTRAEQGFAAIPYELVRPYVSQGSYALTRIGCEADKDSDEFEHFRRRLLAVYGDNVARETKPFAGMEKVLNKLDAEKIPWGIVTNKPGWLTTPLLKELSLDRRAQVVVSGDTIAEKKPHPAPLLLAAKTIGAAPADCVYIGDDERDITAGKAAGMYTLAALYGYIAGSDSPHSWDADATIDHPLDICVWLAGF